MRFPSMAILKVFFLHVNLKLPKIQLLNLIMHMAGDLHPPSLKSACWNFCHISILTGGWFLCVSPTSLPACSFYIRCTPIHSWINKPLLYFFNPTVNINISIAYLLYYGEIHYAFNTFSEYFAGSFSSPGGTRSLTSGAGASRIAYHIQLVRFNSNVE